MSLIAARSISLDSTFKRAQTGTTSTRINRDRLLSYSRIFPTCWPRIAMDMMLLLYHLLWKLNSSFLTDKPFAWEIK